MHDLLEYRYGYRIDMDIIGRWGQGRGQMRERAANGKE